MAKPITPTPPISGKAAVKFNEQVARISRGDISAEERTSADERFARIFSFKPSQPASGAATASAR